MAGGNFVGTSGKPASGTTNGDAIAIVGMACKFPGAPDLASFWRLLESGGNAITEGIPGSGIGRIGQYYPESANQNPACRYAALVDDIDLFDAEFFRISPVEAQFLDPQQRMVLETCWKALEDALVDPDRLKGTRTGVYLGISNNDYRGVSLAATQPTEPAASLYTVAGTSFNTAAGRVAFALGLEGPAMAVDTACSSSLFALHQATASLQRDEADMIVVGGVQAIFLGRLTQLRANAGMLSPDGQCKAFDASANGFVRGEGCGMVVLKRLRDAQADGDRIWGIVRGSAVNQDGTSAGLTVPSGAAQERVIEEALLQAGIAPNEVDFLEAHGTGTQVGDPIELNAAAEVYGRGRTPDSPLLVGSVKTNVGHLEPAAGVAGLMKVLLSMHRGVIPKHLHFNDPTPNVDWDRLPIRVTSENTEWPLVSHRNPRAGISSYGWSGTNVHVVVEGYPDASQPRVDSMGMPQPAGLLLPIHISPSTSPEDSSVESEEARPARVLPLSGKTDEALRDSAKSYLSWLDEQGGDAYGTGKAADAELADMAWSASVARSQFERREAVVFRDAKSLREALNQISDSSGEPFNQRASKIAFAFTGQGNQWVGMGEALYRTEPVFRAILDRCDLLIREERGSSLLDVMFGRSGADGDLDEPRWTQPAIYTLECALTELWSGVGIRPHAVLGHSLGEIAASYAAGVLTLEDGLRFASVRGRIMGDLPGDGAMAAIFAPESEVALAIDEWNKAHPDALLCIGVDNGTHQVISGPIDAVHTLTDDLESAGANVRRLRPSPAYHSALVEPGLDDVEAIFSDLTVSAPSVPLISNIDGRPVAAPMDGAYWRRHARRPVAFRGCVETLAETGVDAVIEIGPHAILGPLVSLNWPSGKGNVESPIVLQSLLRPSFDGSEPERADAFVYAVAGAYKAGLPVDFTGLFAGEERRRISVPGYPFQRRRYWVEGSQRQRSGDAHPLLGEKHESPRGEVMYETEMFPSDPPWLNDHQVFGRVVMPGAVYGAMAATVPLTEGAASTVVEELQLHNPLVYPAHDADSDLEEPGRRMQLVVDAPRDGDSRTFEVFSKGEGDEDWILHAEGRLSPAVGQPGIGERVDLDALKTSLAQQDVSAYYRSKTSAGIEFGPSLRTLEALWGESGEAVGEIVLRNTGDNVDTGIHPLLLDGCFQVLSATRNLSDIGGDATYLPFGWQRLRLDGPLPDRLVCRARLREVVQTGDEEEAAISTPETLTGDLWLYSLDGDVLGELSGFALKRATRAALLSSTETLDDLLYEVVWRERPLEGGLHSAEHLTDPSTVASGTDTFAEYLSEEGVEVRDRAALLNDLERLSRSFSLSALERLGWQREKGSSIAPEVLRERLQVIPEHSRLLERMLRLLADAGVLGRAPNGSYSVTVGAGDPLPDDALIDPEAFADRMLKLHPHGSNELGLLRRSGAALAEVLRGEVDPLSILFPREGPGAADFYFTAPASRASNRMLAEAVAATVANWPEGRRLRIVEVGAGTGSGTSVVLPELPDGDFDYVFTDISAGFFAEAENRFSDSGAPIEYRPLDIEQDPAEQGFELHSYDLVIAVNVLHATRNLEETLSNCRNLLAPSGQLLAVESLRGRGWQDMTFGQLDGWWRYSDAYRPNHAIASPEVWRQALADNGYVDSAVLGGESIGDEGPLGSGVILGQGPAEITMPDGVWVLATDDENAAGGLAAVLGELDQTVIVAGGSQSGNLAPNGPGIFPMSVDAERRESWRELLEGLPAEIPLQGVVHCSSLEGRGTTATTGQMADDVTNMGASALALVQALQDSGLTPAKGLWFLTEGAQALERDYMQKGVGELAGATLWGFGKAIAREAGYFQPRMIDLDPDTPPQVDVLLNELMFPDEETHIVYRSGQRMAARLVEMSDGRTRLALPEGPDWRLVPTTGEGLEGLHAEPASPQPLQSAEVRVAVEAVGLNFSDVLISVGAVEMEPMLGDEFCGRITEVAPDVSEFGMGDRVVGLGIGTFRPDLVTKAEMVAPASSETPAAALATIPTSFVSAELGFQMSGLKMGDRVLIHTASGGVGLAAIQLVQAAGAEVFATASVAKQAYLRSLGISHVCDSRSTDFGKEILDATDGAGVDVVLNSLTGPGFIEASLSCLAQGGRFVEMGRRDIWSAEEMAAARPDIAYSVLEVDALKRQDPATAGASLRRVMERFEAGELEPLVYTRWPMAEIGAAMDFMRSARHIGKNVIAMPPLADGRLRADRTYLVTGGMGGIGTLVAGWLADRGAGVIVLNGRRAPDADAVEAIEALRRQGADVRVELADMTDPAAIDDMLARMNDDLPPLAGVIHSVGVLSDGSLGNQTWERFEQVLWPKVLGAWHLHKATLDQDLDLFVLFSSITGVVGNSGQGNHAAANAFLDQLAGYRRSLGLPGQSIAWGAWSGLGEAEEQRERIERQLAESGTDWISPQQGLRAFDELVRQDITTGMVASVDWPVLAENFEARPPFLEELASDDSDADGSGEADSALDLLSQMRQLPVTDWEPLLSSFLQGEVQAVLRLPNSPAANVGFFDLGMDSLMAVELRNRLNRSLAGEYVVSNTAVFDYPNVESLATHLAEELAETLSAGVPVAQEEPAFTQPPRTVESREDAIAVVGMACRFPGASDLGSYWELLATGSVAITEGRQDSGTWDGATGDPDAEDIVCRRGAFVDDIDWFDSRFFRISPIEARTVDPQQRMLLETSWEALEDAGVDPERLRGSRTGVYAGVGPSEYRDLLEAANVQFGYLGTTGSVAAGRIAFALGLEGPAMPVDLACASSLAAVHQAAVGLQTGEVDLAIAGGVNVVLSPSVSEFMMEIGMLSPSGHCRPFDSSADGYVRGEGCGVVVLKRLSDAEANGDRIWAVIRGSAVNQNGASAGLTVPNGPSQERAMQDALTQAGVAPSDVDYLEAHATGSQLGDPIELNAAASVYGKGRDGERPLLVGTVKSNIGHLEWAAGIASFIKAVLSMNKGVIPPNLQYKDPNENVEWDRIPVRVASEATDWPTVSGRRSLAGVNAFGLSGANAHVLVEGYDSSASDPTEFNASGLPAGAPQPVPALLPEELESLPLTDIATSGRTARLLPLSGKSEGAIRDLATRYLTWLESQGDAASDAVLSDMAWTACVGRSHFPYRAGLVFSDAEQLRHKLRVLADTTDEFGEDSPHKSTKVAFVYTGEGNLQVGMGESLYRNEPVARAVLDRCDDLMRQDRGVSLLDVMFSGSEIGHDLNDSAWAEPAIYALGCALTTQWASVGIRPSVVAGHGTGGLAAAQASGVFSLEDGLRLAIALGDLKKTRLETNGQAARESLQMMFDDVRVVAPSLPLINSETGHLVESSDALDITCWLENDRGTVSPSRCAVALSHLGVDAVVGIGLDSMMARTIYAAWPDSSEKPIAISTLASPSGDEESSESDEGFVRAVASAYEAGLDISFSGLFVGEARRRIAIPTYPFQRRRHWI